MKLSNHRPLVFVKYRHVWRHITYVTLITFEFINNKSIYNYNFCYITSRSSCDINGDIKVLSKESFIINDKNYHKTADQIIPGKTMTYFAVKLKKKRFYLNFNAC